MPRSPKRSQSTNIRVLLVLLVAIQTISFGPGCGYVEGQAIDDYDEVAGRGSQADLAYEQYAERLQQQLESLRKEHDVRCLFSRNGRWFISDYAELSCVVAS